MADGAEAASTEPTLKPDKTIPFKDAFVANFDAAESSDLQVTCRSEIFKVHKNVLCSQSEFFENACKSGFMEASSGAIDLQDDDPDAIKAMLQFCYAADYAYDTALHAKLLNNAQDLFIDQVYATAEKYNIKSLKDLARGKFQTAAYSDWNSPYFPVTIGFVYGSTPPSDRGLRDIVVKLSKDHLKSLLARPEFESTMEEYGDFGRDLVKAIAHRVEPQPDAATYMCGGCRKLMNAWLNPKQSIYCPSCGSSYPYAAWLRWKQ